MRRALGTMLVAVFFVAGPGTARAQDDVTGVWMGQAVIPGQNFTLRLDIMPGDSGISVVMDIPESKLIRFTAPTASVDRGRLRVEVPPGWGLAMFRDIGLRPDEQLIRFDGTLRGDNIVGEVAIAYATFPLTLRRQDHPVSVGTVTQEEVTFVNGDVTLAGTLYKPAGPGPFGALVFTHGSGDQLRNAYAREAEALAAAGVAALVYDKRGAGKSVGANWQVASFDELAADARAAVDYLATRQDIDGLHIGLFGLSQGTWLIGMVANERPQVGFLAQETGKGGAERLAQKLEEGMTRAELVGLYASLLGSGFTPPACVPGSEMFADVPASSQFCRWIEELARRGITGGCGGGNYCPAAPVTRDQMAVFVVRATADEAFHVVGEPGEPAFGNGGVGDCLWRNPPPGTTLLEFANPVSFFKDSDGMVHLAGVPQAVDGPGGDMICDVATDLSDVVIFQLPAGYQPEHLEIFPSGNTTTVTLNLIVPQGGLVVEGQPIPGGSVFVASIADENATTLDGFTFRAAPPEASLTGEPPHVSLQDLRNLLGQR